MRPVLKFLLCNLIAFGFVSGAYGLTIPASEDTVGYLNKLTTGANAAPNLMVDATHTAFLYFNLDEVPHDAVLRWAKLRLFLPSVRVKGAGLGVHVVNSQWDEAAASNQPAVGATRVATIGPEKLGTRRFVTVDVTSTVQSWISGGTMNEGFAIKPISGGSAVSSLYLTSKDGASLGLPAELDLDFKPETEAVGWDQLPASVQAFASTAQLPFNRLPSSIQQFFSPVIISQTSLSQSEGVIGGAVIQGVGLMSYQWYKNGSVLAGKTETTLSLWGLPSGSYELRASNGFANASGGTVGFNRAPLSITMQPSVSFRSETIGSMAVNGSAPFGYEWYKGGESVVVGTQSSLSLKGLSSGEYAVKISDGITSVTSAFVSFDGVIASEVLIPAGTFTMGNNAFGDAPEHEVYLSEFHMGKTEVTYGDWTSVKEWAESHGYSFDNAGYAKGVDYPVAHVSWYDVVKWTNAKSEKEGLSPVYYTDKSQSPESVYREGQVNVSNAMVNWNSSGYRLPTEAEWEKAARGGLRGKLYTSGDTLSESDGNFGEGGSRQVKSYAMNGFGLYDMIGNVWEWCWDWYAPYADFNDPRGSLIGDIRILRGVGCPYGVEYAFVGLRSWDNTGPSATSGHYGFRLARTAVFSGFPSTGQPVVTGTALTVTARGTAPISYQWYKGGVALSGGTASMLSLAGLTVGTYTVQVSNSVGTSTSTALDVSDFMLPAAFSLISGGTYTIGNVIGDDDITDNSVRAVTLSPYSMAVNDTTKAQWATVRTWGLTHGYTDLAEGAGKAATHPVVNVSWYNALKWANAASEKDGLTPCYAVNGTVYRTGEEDSVTCDWSASGYRLPTEAEWEVAARGGLTGKRFPWGDTISQSQANYYSYASGPPYELSQSVDGFPPTYATGGYPYTSPVGSFAANGYGLYDMAGNISQWCWDWYGDTAAGIDPKGAVTGSSHVLRGGFWAANVYDARCARRNLYDPLIGEDYYYGFRLARGAGAPAVGRLGMVSVLGGTLPSESALAGQVVGDFQIGKTEVTWGAWKTVRDWAVNNGYADLVGVGAGTGDNYPVTNVSWYDVVKWCNARSEKEGKRPVYMVNGTTYKTGQSEPTINTTANGYRLPTESEWEWAARGGNQTHGYTYSGSNDLNAGAWYGDNSGNASHEVGTKAANELGIYDMSGNVWEWCWDLYSSGYANRRVRGGSWINDAVGAAVSYRGSNDYPDDRDAYFGFRLACSSGQ